MSGLPTGSSGSAAWIGFGILFLIVCIICPSFLGVLVGIVGFYCFLWLICKFLFGQNGPIF